LPISVVLLVALAEFVGGILILATPFLFFSSTTRQT